MFCGDHLQTASAFFAWLHVSRCRCDLVHDGVVAALELLILNCKVSVMPSGPYNVRSDSLAAAEAPTWHGASLADLDLQDDLTP